MTQTSLVVSRDVIVCSSFNYVYDAALTTFVTL